MRSTLIGMLTLISLVLAACGGTVGSAATSGSPATATQAPSAAASSASAAASSAPSAAVALPADVALKPLGGGTSKGTARFSADALLGESLMTVVMDTIDTSFDTYVVLVVPGTCADQKEPADFDGAVVRKTQTIGKEADSMVNLPLATMGGRPHAILVTNAPGDHNLACGDIVP